MKLKAWCDQEIGRQKWLAEKIGYEPSHISNVKDGKKKCTFALALLIEFHTKGEVPLEKTLRTQEAAFWRDVLSCIRK